MTAVALLGFVGIAGSFSLTHPAVIGLIAVAVSIAVFLLSLRVARIPKDEGPQLGEVSEEVDTHRLEE